MTRSGSEWDLEADVIAVGSGIGGLTSAIAAYDAGSQVVLLEKASKLGGVSAYSGGETYVPGNHKMRELGIAEAESGGRPYLEFLAGGFADLSLMDRLLEFGPQAAEYLEREANVRWKVIRGLPDYYYPAAPGTLAQGRYLEVEPFEGSRLGAWQDKIFASPHIPPGFTYCESIEWGGIANIRNWDFALIEGRVREDQRTLGPGMMSYLVHAALVERAIPAYPETSVRELLCSNGRVEGVRARQRNRDLRVRARRGVILAVGGYDWNRELASYHEHMPEWESLCPPVVEGDNLILGGDVGAAIAGVPPSNLSACFGYRIPGEEHEGEPLWRAVWHSGLPHSIWVNRSGRRFCDESFYRDSLPRIRQWDGIDQSQPNYPPFMIFDQNFRDKYPFGPFMPGQALPNEVAARSRTPAGLALKLGIDPDALMGTLMRFNESAERGEDPEFNRGRFPWANLNGDRTMKNPNLGPVSKPPFFGLQLTCQGAGINAVGLKTDRNAQVVSLRGMPVAGLYAVGNAAAAIDTGAGYQSGLAHLRGMTWGYIAGRHASGTTLE